MEKILASIKDSGQKVLLILDDCIAEVRGKGNAAVEHLIQKIFFKCAKIFGITKNETCNTT